MTWYRCFIRGENFPGSLIGKSDPIGFYTTRWVEAESDTSAEVAVLKLLRADATLALPKEEPKPSMAKVHVEQIAITRSGKSPGTGFTWFAMTDPEAEEAANRLERGAHWS